MSAQRSLPSLLGNLDAVHGRYYAGLHVWGWMFGVSPFAVRLPSAIAVGLATSAVGVRGLEAIGYRPTGTRIPTHRGLVTLFTMSGDAR
ncbi:hypothetical protein [Microbacterium rhizosphaerae]|uniref:Uncharacterized protein n=1 Tax=Microbacterium rhizosphaerae TaxID=1678237 RepID=A0ABZ0SNM9_9MICO|nr:hypothetical protein [Microbacterium rhizosphaerae]WPR90957.1 hypothetical protein SM116_06595 [Microbacterium rhizosphaerae]